MKTAISLLLVGWVTFSFALEVPLQEQMPASEQQQHVEQAFKTFSGCIMQKNIPCITELVSDSGVTLGVDAQKTAKQKISTELSTDKSVRCFFWGQQCQRVRLQACSLLSYLRGPAKAPHFSKPYRYQNHWQTEVRLNTTATTCSSDISVIFQLKGGVWRIVAIPYT